MFTDVTGRLRMLVASTPSSCSLEREKFAEFAKLPIADPTTSTLALYCFSVSSRDEVDTVKRRRARGGRLRGRMTPRTSASCTQHSTSTATAGRSCGWTPRHGAGPRGVRGLGAGRRRLGGLTHSPRISRIAKCDAPAAASTVILHHRLAALASDGMLKRDRGVGDAEEQPRRGPGTTLDRVCAGRAVLCAFSRSLRTRRSIGSPRSRSRSLGRAGPGERRLRLWSRSSAAAV